uniref:Uncharacterized protein n=1 Tax=Streptomyces sp. W75 TaxID=1170711 RepID=I0CEI5_9ACTN|nr:hypothetical protein pCQ4.73 [Streptomyces sp. W75]
MSTPPSRKSPASARLPPQLRKPSTASPRQHRTAPSALLPSAPKRNQQPVTCGTWRRNLREQTHGYAAWPTRSSSVRNSTTRQAAESLQYVRPSLVSEHSARWNFERPSMTTPVPALQRSEQPLLTCGPPARYTFRRHSAVMLERSPQPPQRWLTSRGTLIAPTTHSGTSPRGQRRQRRRSQLSGTRLMPFPMRFGHSAVGRLPQRMNSTISATRLAPPRSASTCSAPQLALLDHDSMVSPPEPDPCAATL